MEQKVVVHLILTVKNSKYKAAKEIYTSLYYVSVNSYSDMEIFR